MQAAAAAKSAAVAAAESQQYCLATSWKFMMCVNKAYGTAYEFVCATKQKKPSDPQNKDKNKL
jgi:hypothetical protein